MRITFPPLPPPPQPHPTLPGLPRRDRESRTDRSLSRFSTLSPSAEHPTILGLAGPEGLGGSGGFQSAGLAEREKLGRQVSFQDGERDRPPSSVQASASTMSGSSSPEKLSRVTTLSSARGEVGSEVEEPEDYGDEDGLAEPAVDDHDSAEAYEEDEEDDDDYDFDEEDDDDAESVEPTSLHISALDLAGYG